MTPKEISETILKQMGGAGKLKAMVAAYDMMYDNEGSLSFKFKGSRKITYCKVTLNDMDLYDMNLGKIAKKEGIPTYKEVKTIEGMYWDQLIPVFESETGLYLSL